MLIRALKAIALLIVVLAVGFVGSIWWKLQPREDPQPLPADLVSLFDEAGLRLLADADARVDYDLLRDNYESQALRSYCGVASSVTVLSALGREIDQDSFFTSQASEVRPRRKVMLGGMSLPELAGLLRAHGAAVTLQHASLSDVEQFRETVVRNLSKEGDFLLVNYQRQVLGQNKVGHISPVAAYDRETDTVLIMDTASYSYPPTWVPVEGLFEAMATLDRSSGKSRGYAEVSLAD